MANELSATSGIGASILKKMLPIIASIVMAGLAGPSGWGRGAAPRAAAWATFWVTFSAAVQPEAAADAPQPKSTGGIEDILKDILGGGGGTPRHAVLPQRHSGG